MVWRGYSVPILLKWYPAASSVAFFCCLVIVIFYHQSIGSLVLSHLVQIFFADWQTLPRLTSGQYKTAIVVLPSYWGWSTSLSTEMIMCEVKTSSHHHISSYNCTVFFGFEIVSLISSSWWVFFITSILARLSCLINCLIVNFNPWTPSAHLHPFIFLGDVTFLPCIFRVILQSSSV